MGKRKQPDFQKKKLRVGRQLPKGKNITDTSFKTKQIITPDQHLSDGDKSLNGLLKLLDTKNASIKIDTLKKIGNYVADNNDTLSLCFPDILSKLGKLLMESDPKVTSTTVNLMSTCIKSLSTLQYQSFAESMVLHLNCMMSHGSPKVKLESLNLLDALLQAHPKVVSKSPKILVNLLDMVSTWSKVTMARKLDEIISSTTTSIQWRLQVFHRMRIFLRAMMVPKENSLACLEDGIVDKKEIRWDGKTRLYLPLYMGGLKPSTLDFSWYSQMKNLDDMRFKHFIFELVPVLSDALLPVIPNAQQTKMLENDVVLSLVAVQYLNTILDILCHIGEWVRPNLKTNDSLRDQKLLKQLQNLVSILIKNGFPYAQHDVGGGNKKPKPDQSDCSQLNLNICCLYTICFMDCNKELEDKLKKPVQEHMRSLFCACSGICDNSILLIVKISKCMMQSQKVDMAYKKLILIGMFDIMENYTLSQHSKLLVSFFMELSLNYDFQYLRSTEGMLNWFKVIFQKLDIMMQSGDIDMEFLNYVRQVCVRKYPEFVENLSNVKHADLISLLQCNIEELQITGIYLIMAMESVPSSLLKDLTKLICGTNIITEKISIRLIRLLHTRFVRPEVSIKEKLMFVKFLLNVGCDTGSLSESMTGYEEMEFLHLLVESMNKTMFCILPSNKWEKHQNIFEACLECLLPYTENELAAQGMLLFMKMVLTNQHYDMPVHVALAVLRIRNKIGYLFGDATVSNHLYYLMFSCFMYVSVMTNDARDHVGMYGVHELSKCLSSCEKLDLCRLLQVSGQIINNFNETEYFYTIRIILFLASRKKILTSHNFIQFFFKQMDNVANQSQLLAPLWNKVYHILE